jgi:uncharacterized protein YabN with tetrapyrrole methylase and pyrophosphatase domain
VELPALLLATKLQRKALSVGWAGPAGDEARMDLGSGLAALTQRVPDSGAGGADAVLAGDEAGTERLVGEILFGLADLSRRLGIDPEHALRSRALAFRDDIVALEREAVAVPMPGGTTH